MQTLNLPNYKASNILQATRLTAITPKASAVLAVQNNAGFIGGDFIILGTPGAETTELLTVSTITDGATITPTASTVFDHPAYESISKLFGSQIKVYRAPNVTGLPPDISTFVFIDGATVNLDIDRAYTQYTDSAGGSGYWYRFTYFNPTTSAETNLSDSNAVRGGSVGDYCSIEDIRGEAGFANAPYITGTKIDGKRQAAQAEINGTLAGYYTVPFTPPINPFISDICKRLAAGLLLLQEYPHSAHPTNAKGQAKVDGARADLQKLVHPEESGSVLIDDNGNSIALPNANTSASGWPNKTTATAPPSQGGAERAFRMSMGQGYQSRAF